MAPLFERKREQSSDYSEDRLSFHSLSERVSFLGSKPRKRISALKSGKSVQITRLRNLRPEKRVFCPGWNRPGSSKSAWQLPIAPRCVRSRVRSAARNGTRIGGEIGWACCGRTGSGPSFRPTTCVKTKLTHRKLDQTPTPLCEDQWADAHRSPLLVEDELPPTSAALPRR